MKIYRVHLYDSDGSHGYEFFTNHATALKRMIEFVENHEFIDTPDGKVRYRDPHPELDTVEFKLTKRGVLQLLNSYADHPDNG